MSKFMKQSYAASDNVKNAISDTTNVIKQIRNVGAPQNVVDKIKSLESNDNLPKSNDNLLKSNDNAVKINDNLNMNAVKKPAPINED